MNKCIGRGMYWDALARAPKTEEERKARVVTQNRAVRKSLVKAVEAFEASQRRGLPQRPLCTSIAYGASRNYQPTPAYAVA